MKYIVGLGEALWDLLPAGPQIGGAPANFAYHAGQFGYPSYAVSAVGKDELGDKLLNAFAEKKLNTLIPQIDRPTGTVEIALDDAGVPQFTICEEVAWDYIPASPKLDELAKQTIAVCFGSLAQRSNVSRQTIYRFLEMMPKDEAVLKVFDMNLRQHFYSHEILQTSLSYCNVLKINEDELPVLVSMFGINGKTDEEQCRNILHQFHLRLVILTQGARGSYVFSHDEESYIETPRVEVADTVGAGDSFTGSFVGSLLTGKSLREAHTVAVRVAAQVCTLQGAMPEISEAMRQCYR